MRSVARLLTGVIVVASVAALVVGVVSAKHAGSTLPLTARVLHAGDFLGLEPQNPVVVIHRAAQWASHEPPGAPFDATLLRKDSFAGGVFENLRWQARNTDGLSMVVQLGSPTAARKYLTIYHGIGDTLPFPVSGIPGARGFGDRGGINIVFADGDYAYLVGAGWNGSAPTVTKPQLLTAAKLLYHRVHEH